MAEHSSRYEIVPGVHVERSDYSSTLSGPTEALIAAGLAEEDWFAVRPRAVKRFWSGGLMVSTDRRANGWSFVCTYHTGQRPYDHEAAGYCLLYSCANDPNPADPRYRDISAVRVRRVWPKPEAR